VVGRYAEVGVDVEDTGLTLNFDEVGKPGLLEVFWVVIRETRFGACVGMRLADPDIVCAVLVD